MVFRMSLSCRVGRVFESHHFPPVDVVGLEDSAHPTKAPRIVATPSGYRRSVRCAGTDTMQDKETPVLELTEQQWQAREFLTRPRRAS